MTIISVHLPKTAGTSFRATLKSAFGNSYLDDYSDGGISVSAHERTSAAAAAGPLIAKQGLHGISCVHGHFLPAKYLLLGQARDLTFVTWMREPVARLISHYHYWQESYDETSSAPHHRQVVEEKWTLEHFCLSERFKNIYAQYFWNFPFERFAFIGISEHYEEDMLEFSARFMSTRIAPQRLNMTKYEGSRTRLSEDILQRVRAFHADDMDLYQRALEQRRARHSANPCKENQR